MGFNSTLVLHLDNDYSIDPSLVLLCSKKWINLTFKNFTTFLCSTKYDLEILSFLTQIVKTEKEKIINMGIADKLDIENDKDDEKFEVRSYYK